MTEVVFIACSVTLKGTGAESNTPRASNVRAVPCFVPYSDVSTYGFRQLERILKAKFHTLAGSELVRSWFEPDSVMEFGLNEYLENESLQAIDCTCTCR